MASNPIDPTVLATLAAQHPYLCFSGAVVWCLTQIVITWLKQPKPPASMAPTEKG